MRLVARALEQLEPGVRPREDDRRRAARHEDLLLALRESRPPAARSRSGRAPREPPRAGPCRRRSGAGRAAAAPRPRVRVAARHGLGDRREVVDARPLDPEEAVFVLRRLAVHEDDAGGVRLGPLIGGRCRSIRSETGRRSRSRARASASVAFSPRSRTRRKRRRWFWRALSRAIWTRSNAAPRRGVLMTTFEPRRSESHVSIGSRASSGRSTGRRISRGRKDRPRSCRNTARGAKPRTPREARRRSPPSSTRANRGPLLLARGARRPPDFRRRRTLRRRPRPRPRSTARAASPRAPRPCAGSRDRPPPSRSSPTRRPHASSRRAAARAPRFARREEKHVLHGVVVRALRREAGHARAEAGVHVVVEAGARQRAVDLDAARPDLEHPLDHLHGPAARARREERSEVAVAVLQHAPRHERPRPVLARRDLDVGVRLVVAEEDVVARLVLLDERVLEGERLALGLRDDRVDRLELGEHRLRLHVLRPRAEVRREPLADRPRLPDVQDLPLGVLVEVDAGLVGVEGEVRERRPRSRFYGRVEASRPERPFRAATRASRP